MFSPSSASYSILIRSIEKSKNQKYFDTILHMLKEEKMSIWDNDLYHSIISCLLHFDRLDEARYYYNDMIFRYQNLLKNGKKPDRLNVSLFFKFIQKLISNGKYDEAIDIYHTLRQLHIELTADIVRTLIIGIIRSSNDFDFLLDILGTIDIGILQEVFNQESMQKMVAVSFSKGKNNYRTTLRFIKFLTESFYFELTNEVANLSLLEYVSRFGFLQTVEFIQQLRQEFNIEPDYNTFISVVNTYIKQKKIQEAEQMVGYLAYYSSHGIESEILTEIIEYHKSHKNMENFKYWSKIKTHLQRIEEVESRAQ
jgi:pentatricopeptide repeat protein